MVKKKVTIIVDGKKYEATYIGKGQYSKVYRVGDRVVMYTKGDCAKEVLSMHLYEHITHLPELIRHENITTRPGIHWYVFSSPFYRDVTTKDKSAYKLMKDIVNCYNEIYYKYWRMGYKGVDLMKMFIMGMDEYKYFPRSVIKALDILVENAGNCGYNDVIFDIHKKNFGVNDYGTLIFRDLVAIK